MRIHSKRWRRWQRNTFRRSKALAMQILARPVNAERDAKKRNKAASWLNRRVNYPRDEGHALIDGAIDCPKCGNSVLTTADPCEWSRNDKCAWRRGRERTWSVTGYWGGTGQCCGLLLAFQPDGRAECYELIK